MEKHGLQLTNEQLNAMADQHIIRHQNRLNGNGLGVNHSECTQYLRLWQGIKEKVAAGKSYEELNSRERSEVMDAYYDEVS